MTVQTSTVSDKYQTVVPTAIGKVLGVKRGQKITWTLQSNSPWPAASVTPAKIDWAKALRGIDKTTWKGIDAQEYINKLRDEWER